MDQKIAAIVSPIFSDLPYCHGEVFGHLKLSFNIVDSVASRENEKGVELIDILRNLIK